MLSFFGLELSVSGSHVQMDPFKGEPNSMPLDPIDYRSWLVMLVEHKHFHGFYWKKETQR